MSGDSNSDVDDIDRFIYAAAADGNYGQTFSTPEDLERFARNFSLEVYENSEFMSSDFFDSVMSMADLDSTEQAQTPASDRSDTRSDSTSTQEDILWNPTPDLAKKKVKREVTNYSDSSQGDDDLSTSSDGNNDHLYEGLLTPSPMGEPDLLKKTLKWISDREEIMVPVAKEHAKSEFTKDMLYESLKPGVVFKERKVQAVPSVTTTSTTLKANTKLMIQNPNNRKLIIKQVPSTPQLKKANLAPKVKPQILHVQPITTADGNSVYLPFNLKSFKILNPSDIETETGLVGTRIEPQPKRRRVQIVDTSSSLSDGGIDDDDQVTLSSQESSMYPALNLTNEEKRLLVKESIQLPTHYPLTKTEERELKRIRRKIRNKISAQDSRKRKKEYVDGLEDRVKRGSEEKKMLIQRIKQLEKQNNRLTQQLSKLQAILFNSSTSKASPSTCLMIVLLSALLVSLPNIRLPESKEVASESEQVPVRRTLLSSPQATEEDVLNMEEFLIFNKEDEMEFEAKFGDANDNDNITDKEVAMLIEKMEAKFGNVPCDKDRLEKETLFKRLVNKVKGFLGDPMIGNTDYGGYKNTNGFIEPDVDDMNDIDGPPPIKMTRTSFEDVPVIAKAVPAAPNSVIISNTKEK